MLRQLAALTAFTLVCAGMASANVLLPGQSNAPDALTLTGTQLIQTAGVLASTGALPFTVNYTVGVYLDTSNPACPGCLDFVYTFTNNGPGGATRISASNFAGMTTDVGYGAATSGQTPATVDRSTDGTTIDFNFTGGATLLPQNSTATLLIDTNATSYFPGTFTVLNGVSASGVGFAPTAAPVSATPEPASLALLGTGLLGAVGVARRRFHR